MKHEVAVGMLLLLHGPKSGQRRFIQWHTSLAPSLRCETQMFLIANVQHTNAPIEVGEFQRQHFLAAKAGVRGKDDELGPIGEMIRMRVPFVLRSGYELLQLILREV